MDIVIVDPTHTDMVQRTLMTTAHETTMTIWEKTQSYTEQTLGDDFIPLVIEMYGCFHSRFDSFMVVCAQTIIMHH